MTYGRVGLGVQTNEVESGMLERGSLEEAKLSKLRRVAASWV